MDTKEKQQRNPIRSKNNIKKAVGEILVKKGYPGLSISNIARQAGVTPRLVKYYYGSVDALILEFLNGRDYPRILEENITNTMSELDSTPFNSLYVLLLAIMENFENNIVEQRLMAWELSEPKDLLKAEAEKRKIFLDNFLDKIQAYTNNLDINRARTVDILLSGIYYIILHAKVNGSTFCGIDYNAKDGKESIQKALGQIVDWFVPTKTVCSSRFPESRIVGSVSKGMQNSFRETRKL